MERLEGEIIIVEKNLPILRKIQDQFPVEEGDFVIEKGGRKFSPALEVDGALWEARTLLSEAERNSKEWERKYNKAAELVWKLLLWIEIGFGGFDNYTRHPTAVDFTIGIGSPLGDPEKQKKELEKDGKEFYQKVLGEFFSFRCRYGISRDIFEREENAPLLSLLREISEQSILSFRCSG